ncbi:30S ribosome-binding factor RbfA [Sediminitomix flava]|uniref:Ribosome-binding factor A n=1 Tax=Sediminitomix flava TaxID=379075 RepID=A0A315Z8Q4_SEDFL|nr:30S ribosome-binding factor RbfA [Sediminitomix flava]PWJ41038.1 ribosome-binding factor A [Sediminitomix flava]
MDSKRQQKFSRLIQKDLGEIFQQNANKWFNGAFITVTQVSVTPDLAMAKVYLSFLMVKDNKAMLQEVKMLTKEIRSTLAQRIRKQARIIPDLVFYYDDTLEVSAQVDKLFEDLDIPPAPEEDEDDDTYKK